MPLAHILVMDETLERWAGAFDGPPETQMEFLRALGDVRDFLVRIDEIVSADIRGDELSERMMLLVKTMKESQNG